MLPLVIPLATVAPVARLAPSIGVLPSPRNASPAPEARNSAYGAFVGFAEAQSNTMSFFKRRNETEVTTQLRI